MADAPRYSKDLERAALALLRQRGFTVVEPPAKKQSLTQPGTPTQRLDQTSSCFARLVDWCEAAAAPRVRRELLSAALPMLCHLMLELTQANDFSKAQSLLNAHSAPFYGLGPSAARLLDRLRNLRSFADLQNDDLHRQFRCEERVVVGMSSLAQRLLLSRLFSPDMEGLAEIFQRRVRVEGAAAGLSAVGDGLLHPEQVEEEAQEINAEKLNFLVDALDPPLAYGENWRCPDESLRKAIPTGSYSANNVALRCGLPIPKRKSRSRLIASRTFVDQVEHRDQIGGDKLPSTCAFVAVPHGEEDVNCLAVSSDARYCVMGASGATLWDLNPLCTGEGVDGDNEEKRQDAIKLFHSHPLRGHSGRVLDTAYSPDSKRLLTAGQDGTLRLWSLDTFIKPEDRGLRTREPSRYCGCFCVYSHYADPVWAVDWCPVDHYFLSSGVRGEALLWSLERSSPLRILGPLASTEVGSAAGADVDVVRAHPSTRYAAVASDESLLLWDMGQATAARAFPGGHGATALAFSPDGSAFVSGDSAGNINFWDISSGRKKHQVTAAHDGPVYALGFSWADAEQPDEPFLFSGGADGSVHLWRTKAGTTMQLGGVGEDHPASSLHVDVETLNGQTSQVLGGGFTPSNVLLVAAVAPEANPRPSDWPAWAGPNW